MGIMLHFNVKHGYQSRSVYSMRRPHSLLHIIPSFYDFVFIYVQLPRQQGIARTKNPKYSREARGNRVDTGIAEACI